MNVLILKIKLTRNEIGHHLYKLKTHLSNFILIFLYVMRQVASIIAFLLNVFHIVQSIDKLSFTTSISW